MNPKCFEMYHFSYFLENLKLIFPLKQQLNVLKLSDGRAYFLILLLIVDLLLSENAFVVYTFWSLLWFSYDPKISFH